MGCLKCGKETGISSVFCDDCLCKMATYPVKPDAAIQLPHRVAAPEDKKPTRRKKQRSTAELLKKARKRNLRLSIIVFLLAIGLAASILMLVHTLDALEKVQNQGKNYTAILD